MSAASPPQKNGTSQLNVNVSTAPSVSRSHASMPHDLFRVVTIQGAGGGEGEHKQHDNDMHNYP